MKLTLARRALLFVFSLALSSLPIAVYKAYVAVNPWMEHATLGDMPVLAVIWTLVFCVCTGFGLAGLMLSIDPDADTVRSSPMWCYLGYGAGVSASLVLGFVAFAGLFPILHALSA